MDVLLGAGIVFGLAALFGGWAYMRSRPPRARLAPDGVQEATIIVRDRYLPPTVVARCGVPLRLSFRRDEDNPCSQRVIFPDFGVARSLPAWGTTTIELLPRREGEFLFTCEMGMYQGTLRVLAGRPLGPRLGLRWP